MDTVYALAQTLKRASKMRQTIELLDRFSDAMDSSTVAKKLDIQRSNARRILTKLKKASAIEEVTGRKRGQMFKITPEGRRALELVKRLLSEIS